MYRRKRGCRNDTTSQQSILNRNVSVSGLRCALALDWYSQGNTVDHINQRSVLDLFQPNFIIFFDKTIGKGIILTFLHSKSLKSINY